MSVAYVLLALLAGALTVWVVLLRMAVLEMEEEVRRSKVRIDVLASKRSYVFDATDARLDSMKDRFGRLRARVRKLEEATSHVE